MFRFCSHYKVTKNLGTANPFISQKKAFPAASILYKAGIRVNKNHAPRPILGKSNYINLSIFNYRLVVTIASNPYINAVESKTFI